MYTPPKIGDIVRCKRRSLAWSQKELAERMKVSRQAVSLIERGHTRFHRCRNHLERLSQVLSVPIEELLDARGDCRVYQSRIKRKPGSIGAFITKWRNDRGTTQVQLARIIGISYATLSLIETGKKKPTSKTWRKLAEVIRGLPRI